MTNFDNLDITKGFVLDQYDAAEYLKYIAYEQFKEVMNDDADAEGLEAIIEELKDMIKAIENTDFEYWRISEHQMAASGIVITPMEEAKQ